MSLQSDLKAIFPKIPDVGTKLAKPSPITKPVPGGKIVSWDEYKRLMDPTRLSDMDHAAEYIRELTIERNAIDEYLKGIRKKLGKIRSRLYHHRKQQLGLE